MYLSFKFSDLENLHQALDNETMDQRPRPRENEENKSIGHFTFLFLLPFVICTIGAVFNQER